MRLLLALYAGNIPVSIPSDQSPCVACGSCLWLMPVANLPGQMMSRDWVQDDVRLPHRG
jgi:hypothetical protein